MLYIYKVPLGTQLREEFAAYCSKSGYQESFLLLPSSIIMQQIRHKFNIRMGNFDNLTTELLSIMAPTIGAPLDKLTQDILLTQVVQSAKSEGKLQYFGKIAQSSGFRQSLANVLIELITNKISAEQFSLALDSVLDIIDSDEQKKYQELIEIYSAYYSRMLTLGKYDIYFHYRLLDSLLDNIKTEQLGSLTNIYISDFYYFNKLELSIIHKLGKLIDIHIAITYEKDRPLIFASMQNLLDNLLSSPNAVLVEKVYPDFTYTEDLQLLRNSLYNFNTADMTSSNITINGFNNYTQEMQAVAADIKKKLLGGTAPSDITIIMRDLTDYSGLLKVMQNFAIPCSLPETVCLGKHFLTELILDCLRLARRGFHKPLLAKVLLSPLSVSCLNITKEKLERYMYERPLTDYTQLLIYLNELDSQAAAKTQELIESLSSIPNSAFFGRYAQLLLQILAKLDVLSTLGKQYRNADISLEYFKSSLYIFDYLQTLLQQLSQAHNLIYGNKHNITLTDFIDYLQNYFSGRCISIPPSCKDSVNIWQAADVQGINIKHVYILGLNEGSFPKSKTDNWLLGHAQMHKLLLIDGYEAERYIYEDNFFMANCIAAAMDTLTLSYIQTDQLLPSKYLTEISRLFTITPTIHINMLPTNLTDIYDTKTLQLYLARAFAQGNISYDAVEWLNKQFGGVLDILTDSACVTVTPDNLTTTFSVTQLETYASCPFRYMAAYIWQLRPWQKEQPDADNRLLGNLIHDVLDVFVKKHLNSVLTDYDNLQKELIGILHDKAEEYLQLGRVYQPITWYLQTATIQRKLISWLKAHKNEPSMVFYAGEYAFFECTIAKSEIFGDIKLSGKIDRIDQGTQGMRIVDYKLGSLPTMKDINKGLSLQMLLYMHVINQKFADYKQLVPQYYSFKANEYKEAFNLKKADISELLHNAQEHAKNYALAIHQGEFAPKPASSSVCRYCNYSTICRFVVPNTEQEEEN